MTLLATLSRVVHDPESRALLQARLHSWSDLGQLLAELPSVADRRVAARRAVEWLAEETGSPALRLTLSLLEETRSPSTELHLCRTGLALFRRPAWALGQAARELLAYTPPDTSRGREEADRLAVRALLALSERPETSSAARLGLSLIRILPERALELARAALSRPFSGLAATCLALLDVLEGVYRSDALVRLVVEALSEGYRAPTVLLELELARQNGWRGLRPVLETLAA